MTHRVTSLAALETLYDAPVAHALAKETPVLNAAYRQLLAACPFAGLATIGPEGMDCSPRGDRPGFIRVLDDRTLALPDRRGNNRLDSLRNIVRDGRVSLLCLIPGWNECLRVNGQAHLTTDPDLCAALAEAGKVPVSVIVIRIETMYFQCARAIKRAGLWDPARHVDRASLPTAGQLTRSVISDFDAEAYDAALQERQAQTLY